MFGLKPQFCSLFGQLSCGSTVFVLSITTKCISIPNDIPLVTGIRYSIKKFLIVKHSTLVALHFRYKKLSETKLELIQISLEPVTCTELSPNWASCKFILVPSIKVFGKSNWLRHRKISPGYKTWNIFSRVHGLIITL